MSVSWNDGSALGVYLYEKEQNFMNQSQYLKCGEQSKNNEEYIDVAVRGGAEYYVRVSDKNSTSFAN